MNRIPRPLLLLLNILGVIAFAAFAWLQLEDDNPDVYVDPSVFDAWLWFSFYALVAVLFGIAILRKFPWPVYGLAVLFCLYQLVVTGPGVIANLGGDSFSMAKESMAPERPQVELSREFFGALIALVAVAFLWLQRRAGLKPKEGSLS